MSTKTREKKSVAKIVGFVLLGILVLVAAISGFLLTHYSGLLGDLREEERGNAIAETAEANAGEQIVAPTSIADDVFTILLVGVDSYQDTYTGRSDVQMLMSINQKSKKIVLCSILRDSYVSIPGHGNNRINAAYGKGGTNLLTQTIKNNFGIPVNRVAVINFKVVVDFVDAIGGVDVDLSPEEVEIINNGASGYLNGAGMNHLNGDQALTYARIRKIDNDFSRTKRQRVVMEDALEKIGAEFPHDGVPAACPYRPHKVGSHQPRFARVTSQELPGQQLCHPGGRLLVRYDGPGHGGPRYRLRHQPQSLGRRCIIKHKRLQFVTSLCEVHCLYSPHFSVFSLTDVDFFVVNVHEQGANTTGYVPKNYKKVSKI